ncbi:MAG TPA: hypothetical protein DCO72_02425 [Ruminococcus sp.]|nr:hypothetical protein [Ruminococcus sp.]
MTYVLQTRCGQEEKFCQRLKQSGLNAFVPMKNLFIRRKGKWTLQTAPIFGGYIFLNAEMNSDIRRQICQTEGVRFIGNGVPTAISQTESAYIDFLYNGGQPLPPSKVRVDENGRVQLVSGILANYEDSGIIFHLRQRRAFVSIPIMGKMRTVSFGLVIVK